MIFEQLEADLTGHPITGYTHTGEYISLPLISHIEDNLYVGGCKNNVDLGDYFTHVFSMYKWEKYRVGTGTRVFTVEMYDSNDEPDAAQVDEIADRVLQALDAGGNVLVHCQAGINRSNLITVAALMKRGRSAQEAIDLLRERRGQIVLANKTFERHLLNR